MKEEKFITILLMCFTLLIWVFYALFKIPIWMPVLFNLLQVFWLIVVVFNPNK